MMNGVKSVWRSPMKREWLFMGLFALLYLFFCWFTNDADRVEHYYGRKLFPFFATGGQWLWRSVPFSVGDCFYLLLILVAVLFAFFVIRSFVRKRPLEAIMWFLRALNVSFGLLTAFYLFWGTNYFRLPMARRLDYTAPKAHLLPSLAEWLVDRANEQRAALDSVSFSVDKSSIYAEAERLMALQEVDEALFVYAPKIKEPMSNGFTSLMLVSGYFNPFTQEVQVNGDVPLVGLPFTSCHELSHQSGVGFEDEANFLAFLLSVRSKDKLFQYSAYYSSLWPVLGAIYGQDTVAYQRLLDRLSPAVRNDMRAEQAYWERYQGMVNRVSSYFYNGYLQVNNQPEGLARYNAMVLLLLSWYEKTILAHT
ncbi:DUF3810 domain-containing protein [Olivibacter sitiensis]|uniref:DUF3810 domain-containing protein n=1 Tax=Olivibacter sitiensis TaxID=376470 RepID=UPI0003F9B1CF|nr:DUF3810 domain-containing protein [Olivibacter sitiensis]